MARKPRILIPGYHYHIISRGNNKMTIFLEEEDREVFLKYIKEAKETCPISIFAYSLMPNHLHLLLKPAEEDTIPNFMHRVETRYARYFNDKYERTGSIWEGRYKGCLIDSDSYLITCYRYIEWNSVRANIVEHPSQYRWASYYIRERNFKDKILDWDDCLVDLSENDTIKRENYLEVVSTPPSNDELKEVREAIRKGILGKRNFIEKISKITQREISFRSKGRPRIRLK